MAKNTGLLDNSCDVLASSCESDTIYITISNCSQNEIKIELNRDWLKTEITNFARYIKRREDYLFTAIRNLIKKINFLELLQQQLNEEITEDEFDNEITNNPDKYTIQVRPIGNKEDILIINNIMNKIGFDLREFSVNEVGELFSINPCHLLEYFQNDPTQANISK
jgi:hypothetical protein